MKKTILKLTLVLCFLLSALCSFAQGGFGSDGAFHPTGSYPIILGTETKGVTYPVTDITALNAIPHNFLTAGQRIWVVSLSSYYSWDGSAWSAVVGGSTIYSGDGSLSGDRVVNTRYHSLTISDSTGQTTFGFIADKINPIIYSYAANYSGSGFATINAQPSQILLLRNDSVTNQQQSLRMGDTGVVYTDNITHRDLMAANNYGSTLTPFSYITKYEADSLYTGGYTFSNGITNTGGDVQLGGADSVLNNNNILVGTGSTFSISSPNAFLIFQNQSGNGGVSLSSVYGGKGGALQISQGVTELRNFTGSTGFGQFLDMPVNGPVTLEDDNHVFMAYQGVGYTSSLPNAIPDQATSQRYSNLAASGGNYVNDATTTALPSNTYANGTSGVGATLTATANGVLGSQDGVSPVSGQLILVQNEATQSHNGVYTITTVGTSTTKYKLTRASNYNALPALNSGSNVYVLAGTANAGKVFYQTTSGVITIGTTNLVYATATAGVVTETDPTVPAYAKSLASFSNIQTSTDALYPSLTGAYSNPPWITSLAWSKITGAPTTVAGYGITDILTQPLTGYASGAGTVGSSDGILAAIQKINGNQATDAANISTNTSNIATNTSSIATNTSSIASSYTAIGLKEAKIITANPTAPYTSIASGDSVNMALYKLQAQLNTINSNTRANKGALSNMYAVSYGGRAPWQTATFSDGTATTETSRIHHISVGSISDLHVVYCNFPGIAAKTSDANPSVDVTIQVSIEYPAGTFTNVYFYGASTYLLRLQSTVVSDAIPLNIPDATDFWIRTNVLVTSGQKWVRNQATNTNFSEGIAANTNSYNSGTITNSTGYCFGPSAILGTSTTNKGSILWIGDSLTTGTNDSGGGTSNTTPFSEGAGYYWRAFGSSYPGIYCNLAGQQTQYWNPTVSTATVKNFSTLMSGCQYAISNLGVNDFGTLTAAQLEQSWLNFWAPLKAKGISTYQGTITPKTTSTDSWATTGNQTVTGSEAVRVAANTWLRDGAPYNYTTMVPAATGATGANIIRIGSPIHALAGMIEFANVVETSQNSGIWKAPSYTIDGLHGTSTSYPLLAAAITAIITSFNKF